MPTNQPIFSNFGTLIVEGNADISSGAAVVPVVYPNNVTQTARGDALTCTKNGTGTYDFKLAGTSALKQVEILQATCNIMAVTVATALFSRVLSVVQSAVDDSITIKVATVSAAGAAIDTTAAINIAFTVSLRVARMQQAL